MLGSGGGGGVHQWLRGKDREIREGGQVVGGGTRGGRCHERVYRLDYKH